jgi:DNA-3-methyladenine glycosylase II
MAARLMSPAKPISATPDYWEEACKHLVKKDRVMKRLIPQFGDCLLYTSPGPRD